MGYRWLSKEQVGAIVASYRQTNSIIKTMEELHLSEVKVRRVLITEGMWSSETSKRIGSLKEAGMSTAEIAERLCMSVKNVQAYMPYENGAYGDRTKSAFDSRRSRDKARGKIGVNETKKRSESDGSETTVEMKEVMETINAPKDYEGDLHKLMQYAVDQGKLILLADSLCSVENGLSVVKQETIDAVREFERELLPSSSRSFIYIDCAPEIMNYASPGMPDGDAWFCSELLDNGNVSTKKRIKLTFNQFVDRLSTCVTGSRLNGSAYEKILQTQVDLLRKREKVVLVFVNAHLLCDRSGGKNSKYTSVGDMIGVVRQIWDRTGVPIIFLTSEEILRVLDKDDEGRKLKLRVSIATV